VAAAAIMFVTPIILYDISRAPGFPIPTFVAFGLPSPGLWLNFFARRFEVPFELGGPLLYLIGSLMFFAGVHLVYFSSLRHKFSSGFLPPLTVSPFCRNVFLVSSGLYLSCFLAGMNYDYRLYFLIVSLLLFNQIFPDFRKSRLFLILQISALWATVFFFGIEGPIHVFLAMFGNFCQLLLAIYLLGAMYRVLESHALHKWVVQLPNKVFRKA
jgi:hypothetical protein